MTKLKTQQTKIDELHKRLDAFRKHSPAPPIPIVTSADIERIVRRDFPAEQVAEVLTVLDGYGIDTSHHEPQRVRLAALKMAGGELAFLRNIIGGITVGYDIITHEEYPGYLRELYIVRMIDLPQEAWQRIIDADCKQYQDWFR